MKRNYSLPFLLLLSAFFTLYKTIAQPYIFKDPPVLKIDFGSRGNPSAFKMEHLRYYDQQSGTCPDDGNYSLASFTSDCFNGDWITMNEDHTPGDYDGKMLLVNASRTPGTFFQYSISNIKPNTLYEFSCWIVNVCRTSSPCNPTPPYLSFILLSNGKSIFKVIGTGQVPPTNAPSWRRYYGEFTTPANLSELTIRMNDETSGGCGNDFAIDDILLREIEIPKPITPPVKEVARPVVKPVAKQPAAERNETAPVIPALKKESTIVTKNEVKAAPTVTKTVIKEKAEKIPVPDVLLSRSNPVVKEITTEETEMLIQLYDNGEVDGDTVTVYDNNVLLAANAGLSEKPVTIKIKVDKQHPHHELVMVANNLGSIPPNTSLMVITANEKRYEVFISSSKQKNAKILINLLE